VLYLYLQIKDLKYSRRLGGKTKKAGKRYLGVFSLAAMGIGSMVGAGIFALPGEAGLLAGAASYISFFIGGVVALLSGYSGRAIAHFLSGSFLIKNGQASNTRKHEAHS